MKQQADEQKAAVAAAASEGAREEEIEQLGVLAPVEEVSAAELLEAVDCTIKWLMALSKDDAPTDDHAAAERSVSFLDKDGACMIVVCGA